MPPLARVLTPPSPGRVCIRDLATRLNRPHQTIESWVNKRRLDFSIPEQSILEEDVAIIEELDRTCKRVGRWRADGPIPAPQAPKDSAAMQREPVRALMPDAVASVTVPIGNDTIAAAALMNKTPREFILLAVTAYMANMRRLLGQR